MRSDKRPDDAPSLGYDALPTAAERREHVLNQQMYGTPPRHRIADDPIDWRKSTALGFAILIVTAAALAAFAFLLFEAGRQAEREKIKAAAVEGLRR